jgi:hypothetical protein
MIDAQGKRLLRPVFAAGWVFALATTLSFGLTAQEVDLSSARALTAQALAFEHGEGVPKDPLRAANLYCDAARAGDPEAMFNLGWMYANGRGVERDDASAAALFARAAALGHTYAQRMLAVVGDDPNFVSPCMPSPELEQVDIAIDEAPDPFAALTPQKKKVADLVVKLAPSYGVAPRLALSIVAAESNFEPMARSPKDAHGAMQLIAGTAARFHVKNRFDTTDNVRGGLSYLRWLLAYYEGRVRLVVAAYNAGEAAVDRYGGVPPYRETLDYVERVLRWFPREWHAFDPDVVGPSPVVIGVGASSR